LLGAFGVTGAYLHIYLLAFMVDEEIHYVEESQLVGHDKAAIRSVFKLSSVMA
jgi:hypothetical protein